MKYILTILLSLYGATSHAKSEVLCNLIQNKKANDTREIKVTKTITLTDSKTDETLGSLHGYEFKLKTEIVKEADENIPMMWIHASGKDTRLIAVGIKHVELTISSKEHAPTAECSLK